MKEDIQCSLFFFWKSRMLMFGLLLSIYSMTSPLMSWIPLPCKSLGHGHEVTCDKTFYSCVGLRWHHLPILESISEVTKQLGIDTLGIVPDIWWPKGRREVRMTIERSGCLKCLIFGEMCHLTRRVDRCLKWEVIIECSSCVAFWMIGAKRMTPTVAQFLWESGLLQVIVGLFLNS